MVTVLLASMLAGCKPSGPRPPTDYGDVPTDTFPQFYGSVPKNILMISIDTFRRDHLDRYGSEGASPFLTALANAGVAADDHHQCSNWTYASMTCTVAGRYNEEAGMTPQLVGGFDESWPIGTPFLASYLQEKGVYGIAVSSNGWFGPKYNDTDGYREAFYPSGFEAWTVYDEGRDHLDDAILRGDADRWMLHIHLTEPHASYDPPESYLGGLAALEPVPWDLTDRAEQYELGREVWPAMTEAERQLLEAHLRVRYAGEIRYVDDEVFRIIADLDFDGLLEDTLVVVWTDHGEAFWEHGFQTHAYTLHGEENDGVLFFWAKNIVPASWSGPTSAIDLVPTLLALQGLDLPPEVTGIPLGEAPPDRPIFSHTIARIGPASSVQQNGWKLIFAWQSGQVRLYDRNTDPLETLDLYDAESPPPMALALWSVLLPRVELQSSVAPTYPILWPRELTTDH